MPPFLRHHRPLTLLLGASNVVLGWQRAVAAPHHETIFVQALLLDVHFMQLLGLVQAVLGVLLALGAEQLLVLTAASLLHATVVVAALSAGTGTAPLVAMPREWGGSPQSAEAQALLFAAAWLGIHLVGVAVVARSGR